MAILLQESKREIQDQSRLAPPSGFRNRTMPSEMVGTNTFTLVQTDEFECGITVFVYTIRLKCNVACINAVLKNGHIQAIQYPIHKIIHHQNINIIIEEPPFFIMVVPCFAFIFISVMRNFNEEISGLADTAVGNKADCLCGCPFS